MIVKYFAWLKTITEVDEEVIQDSTIHDVTTLKIFLIKKYPNEIKLLQMVKHENIISIIDFYKKRNMLYIVMEYATNGNLEQKID